MWTLPAAFFRLVQTPAVATPSTTINIVFTVPANTPGEALAKPQMFMTGITNMMSPRRRPPTSPPAVPSPFAVTSTA
jgi:hypothetical protein